MGSEIKAVICLLCFTLTETLKDHLFSEGDIKKTLFNNCQGEKESERGFSENQINVEYTLPLGNHLDLISEGEDLIKNNTHLNNLQDDMITGNLKHLNYSPQYVHIKNEINSAGSSKSNENRESLRDRNTKLDSPTYRSLRSKYLNGIENKNGYLQKISNIIRQNDEDKALPGLLTLSGNKKLPSNFNIMYNKDNDPIILYKGPIDKNTYFKTKKRDVENEEQELKELLKMYDYNHKLVNPYLNRNLLKSNRIPQKYNYKDDLSFGYLNSNDNTFDGNFDWKLRDSNYKDLQDIFFKKQVKSPISLKIFNHRKMANSSVNTDEYRPTFHPLYVTTVDSITMSPIRNQAKQNNTNIIKLHGDQNFNGIKSSSKNLIINTHFTKNSNCSSKTNGCHPQGGEPKFHKEKLLPDPRDQQYNDVLRGILTINVVQKIINKVSKNEKMRNEFGLCYKNISQVTPNVLNKVCTTTCTPLYGELKCYLNWLLAVDLTRVQRSHYYKVKPDRNFLFDQDFLNPWPRKEKREAIALPPSLYGFTQPIYRLGKNSYTSNIHDEPLFAEQVDNQLIYRSKIVLLPEDED